MAEVHIVLCFERRLTRIGHDLVILYLVTFPPWKREAVTKVTNEIDFGLRIARIFQKLSKSMVKYLVVRTRVCDLFPRSRIIKSHLCFPRLLSRSSVTITNQ